MGLEADFLEACRRGNQETVNKLLNKKKHSANRLGGLRHKESKDHKAHLVNSSDWNKETALHLAALGNHGDIVKVLLEHGADREVQDNQGCTPLHLAAFNNSRTICDDLLSEQSMRIVNTQNKSGDTALHIAAQYGHIEVVAILLKHQANPMIRNLRGESCLDLCSFYGQISTVKLLIKEMPELLQQVQSSHRPDDKISPLHLASRNGQVEVVQQLLSSGFNINSMTAAGSALHEAAVFGKSKVCEVLLKAGIDTSLRDSNGSTVEAILENNHTELYNNLRQLVKEYSIARSRNSSRSPPFADPASRQLSSRRSPALSLSSAGTSGLGSPELLSSGRSSTQSRGSVDSNRSRHFSSPTKLSSSPKDPLRVSLPADRDSTVTITNEACDAGSSEHIYHQLISNRPCADPNCQYQLSTAHTSQAAPLSPDKIRHESRGSHDSDYNSTVFSLSPPTHDGGDLENNYFNTGKLKGSSSQSSSNPPKKPPREPTISSSSILSVETTPPQLPVYSYLDELEDSIYDIPPTRFTNNTTTESDYDIPPLRQPIDHIEFPEESLYDVPASRADIEQLESPYDYPPNKYPCDAPDISDDYAYDYPPSKYTSDTPNLSDDFLYDYPPSRIQSSKSSKSQSCRGSSKFDVLVPPPPCSKTIEKKANDESLPGGDYVQLRITPNLYSSEHAQIGRKESNQSTASTSSQTVEHTTDSSTSPLDSEPISAPWTPSSERTASFVKQTDTSTINPTITESIDQMMTESTNQTIATPTNQMMSESTSQMEAVDRTETYENADIIKQIKMSKKKKPQVTPRITLQQKAQAENLAQETLIQTQDHSVASPCQPENSAALITQPVVDQKAEAEQKTETAEPQADVSAAVHSKAPPVPLRIINRNQAQSLTTSRSTRRNSRPVTVLEHRRPTFSGSDDDMNGDTDDDLYAEWKQIDGIFAEMGCGKDEASFLQFLQKGNKQETMSEWLEKIGLPQYENVLVVNGFDSVPMLNGVLEAEDLDLMGLTNQEHIETILRELSLLSPLQPIDPNDPPSTVSEWLTSLDLSTYLDNFYTNHYTNMERVLQIWHLELSSVLSIKLLGHQKRLLHSLGENRPGFSSTLKRRTRIADVSNIVRVKDIRYNGEGQDEQYFKHNFSHLKHTGSPLISKRSGSPATSLGRSDSGCSIGSDGTRPEVPERHYNGQLTGSSPPSIPRKMSAARSEQSKMTPLPLQRDQTYSGQTYYPGQSHTLSDISRKQSSPDHTGYLTIKDRHVPSTGILEDRMRTASLKSGSPFYSSNDYANLTEAGVPLIGNLDGLKLSKATSSSKRVLSRIKRPLPNLPPPEEITFSVADLPPDFKGIHKPDILINGCINYSSCYLGTCVVPDFTGAETTRDSIAKMKNMTESIAKLPIVVLAISFKGVNFIDAVSKKPICEHEITNIFCAAQDSNLMNYFAYITKDVLTMGLYCHVFCVKSEDLSREIILTLGEAFNIAFYAAKKHKALLDPDP